MAKILNFMLINMKMYSKHTCDWSKLVQWVKQKSAYQIFFIGNYTLTYATHLNIAFFSAKHQAYCNNISLLGRSYKPSLRALCYQSKKLLLYFFTVSFLPHLNVLLNLNWPLAISSLLTTGVCTLGDGVCPPWRACWCETLFLKSNFGLFPVLLLEKAKVGGSFQPRAESPL